jgi:hypothetical protein
MEPPSGAPRGVHDLQRAHWRKRPRPRNIRPTVVGSVHTPGTEWQALAAAAHGEVFRAASATGSLWQPWKTGPYRTGPGLGAPRAQAPIRRPCGRALNWHWGAHWIQSILCQECRGHRRPAPPSRPRRPSLPDGCSPPPPQRPGAARFSGKDGRPSDKCRCLPDLSLACPAASTFVSARLPLKLRLAPDTGCQRARLVLLRPGKAGPYRNGPGAFRAQAPT